MITADKKKWKQCQETLKGQPQPLSPPEEPPSSYSCSPIFYPNLPLRQLNEPRLSESSSEADESWITYQDVIPCRTLFDLRSTLSASFDDYDFSDVSSEAFSLIPNFNFMVALFDSKIEAVIHNYRELKQAMWMEIDATIKIEDSRLYRYTLFEDINKHMSEEQPQIAEPKYEYLDHTADVQLHSWGKTLEEAFEQVLISMYGYMSDLDTVQMRYSFDFEVIGVDLMSLLARFLDEALFAFSTEPFFIGRVAKVLNFDRSNCALHVRCWGESFDLAVHPQGTEVKAITYSNMQINETPDRTDIFVIIDI